MEEADASTILIKQNFFNASNLDGFMFINRNGKHAKGFKSYNLEDITSDLSYFSVQCELDAKSTIDVRINYEPLSLIF